MKYVGTAPIIPITSDTHLIAVKSRLNDGKIWYWMESEGRNTYEVDFIFEYKVKALAMEVKSGSGRWGASRNSEIGCGIAGFTPQEVAQFFKAVIDEGIQNVYLPESFVGALGGGGG